MDLSGSFTDAMRYVAERKVLRTLIKNAYDEEQASQAQGARQELGLLGVPQQPLNDIVNRYNQGEISYPGALARFHHQVPGTLSQLGNVPSAMGVALQQGRPNDALNQADVLGLKNVNPLSDNFSPTAFGLAGAGAIGGTALAKKIQDNRRMWELLRNQHGGRDPFLATGGKDKPPGVLTKPHENVVPTLNAWRNIPENVPTTNDWWKNQQQNLSQRYQDLRGGSLRDVPGWAKQQGKDLLSGAKNVAKYNIIGPQDIHPSDVSAGFRRHRPGVPTSETLTRGHMEAALNASRQQEAKELGLLGRIGNTATHPLTMGLAAATIPTLAYEWMHPKGYRSGINPFNKLLHQQPRDQQQNQ